MQDLLFQPEESKPDALTQARIEYDRAVDEMAFLHSQAVYYHGLASEAVMQVDAARKNVERTRLKLEHAERWAAGKRP